jgi:hypothetical protein
MASFKEFWAIRTESRHSRKWNIAVSSSGMESLNLEIYFRISIRLELLLLFGAADQKHIVYFGIGSSKRDTLAAMGILNVNEYFNCTVQWHILIPFFHRSRYLSFYVPGLSILVPSFMTILMRFITVSVAMTMTVVPWMSPSLSSALHTDTVSQ